MSTMDQTSALPEPVASAVRSAFEDWRAGRKMERLWARDATLWTGNDESRWLGWLGVTEDWPSTAPSLQRLANAVKARGFTHALLLGMGGSSLCPEVMSATFGPLRGFPAFHVLDSTDPAQVRAVDQQVDLARALVIVSSKSGSTLEPNIFKQYFFERMKQAVGARDAGSHFVAITDPGSTLEQAAGAEGFAYLFHGVPTIGGRYSALSNFGLVPSAVMGIDVPRFIDRTRTLVDACSSSVPLEENPGAQLGILLGAAARGGRDKVTLVTSPRLCDLGAWLEQLLAESTGKAGTGLIPVDLERLGGPEVYGADRVFVHLRLEGDRDTAQEAALAALERAGHPVVRITLADVYDLGQEFFRWEIATAVAGSILGINAFDQPDVEASKVETRKLTSQYERTGSLPVETPIWEGEAVRLFTDAANAAALRRDAGQKPTLAGWLRAHVNRLGAGDYFAILAFVERNEAHRELLQAARHAVRDARKVATCLGFGPRFLHSTGQAYKGGPNTGVFLQITCDDAADLPVPGQNYTFGVVKAAQSRGDFQVLADRGRRALRVHLGRDVPAGLALLRVAMARALA
jgi:transaldolase/glucose-6-phosphate isomerase